MAEAAVDTEAALTKLTDAIRKSKGQRKQILAKFGFIPHSILRISRGKLSASMFIYQHERPERGSVRTSEDNCASEETKTRSRALKAAKMLGGTLQKRKGGSSGGYENRLNASTMPAELVAFFVRYYGEPGGVYLDPFMGQGVQMQVAYLMGLNYAGYDCSEEFFAYIEGVRDRIFRTDGPWIQAVCGDSRHPDAITDGIGTVGFTSPPYWDVEYYGDEAAQLGNGQTYEDFLVGMEDVARAWLPKFKPGARFVVNVNDIRRNGRFYPYHADTIALFQRAGWELDDLWVIDGLVGGLPKAFAVRFNLLKVAPKVHEYAIVFRRPDTQRPKEVGSEVDDSTVARESEDG
jgi:hypothetical protein